MQCSLIVEAEMKCNTFSVLTLIAAQETITKCVIEITLPTKEHSKQFIELVTIQAIYSVAHPV